jgi:hypothetical protein
MGTPCRDSSCRDADDLPLALGPRFERRVPQQTVSVVGDLQRPNNENDHTGAGLSRYSFACLTIDWPAKRIAWAIAEREIFPPHSLMISSQSMPAATSSRTSLSRIRVPRKVSLPWQTLGSARVQSPCCALLPHFAGRVENYRL